jgi:hypothetical protein
MLQKRAILYYTIKSNEQLGGKKDGDERRHSKNINY